MDERIPQWIREVREELLSSINKHEGWSKVEPILERINILLCIAASETDNDFLYDDILKEIRYEETEI